jgi:hypothetical protein
VSQSSWPRVFIDLGDENHQLAMVRAIRSQEAGCWLPLTLARAAPLSAKEASNSIPVSALANSAPELQAYVIKCNANLNEKCRLLYDVVIKCDYKNVVGYWSQGWIIRPRKFR